MSETRLGRMPHELPPPINHAVLTGTICGEPQIARGPAGDPVALFRVEFLVADPADPQRLWTPARCMVEVPLDRAGDVDELRPGNAVLAAGQISERWVIEGGRTGRSSAIVARLVEQGATQRRKFYPA